MKTYKTRELIKRFESRAGIKTELPEPKSDYTFYQEWTEFRTGIESELEGVLR